MSAVLAPPPKFRAIDAAGNPLVGGKLYSYAVGTTTPQATYTDATMGASNANPVVLDANGEANLWLNPSLSYKLKLEDANGVPQWTVDDIYPDRAANAVAATIAGGFAYLCGPVSDRPTPSANYGAANHGLVYFALDERKAYRWDGVSWVDVTGSLFPAPAARTSTINYVIDGGGSVPATGVKGQVYVPFACTITGWVITGDASGSAVVDVLRSTDAAFPTTASIAGTEKPTLTAQQKNKSLALSNWGSAALAQGDQLQFNLTSVATCKRINLAIVVSIP